MGTAHTLRGLLSILLTAALVFSFWGVPARAEETIEGEQETLPAAAEETKTPESTQAEQPPAETTQAAVPEETVPAETEETVMAPPEVTLTAISQVKAMEGETVTIEGTVVYAQDGLTVLQDSSGGIRLSFSEDVSVSAELVLRATGSLGSDGFQVTGWEVRGRAPLPEQEAVIGSIPEYQRVVLKGVSFEYGELIHGGSSVPLEPASPDGISRGDRVNAWGVLAEGCFFADTVIRLETDPVPEETAPVPEETVPVPEETLPGTAPVVTATPDNGLLLAGENIALHCAVEGASVYYSYSYDGTFYSDEALYSGGIPVDSSREGIYVRAYAVTAGGITGVRSEWYFTWENRESQTPEEEENPGWNFYFGQLHAHTAISDGMGDVEEVFAYAKAQGLDFFAVTDHSDSFDDTTAGIITEAKTDSEEWLAGKAAEAAVTDGSFVGIFGYEMSWDERPRKGHITTFNTCGWQSTAQTGFSDLENYYEVLTSAPDSISQFNHPGDADYDDYGDFEDFGHYSAKYDALIHLLEVGSGDGHTAYGEYTKALDAGWHVAPTNSRASRNVMEEGVGQVRTVVLAKNLSRESLFDAIRNHRVYATEDKDLQIEYYLNGAIMGSVLDTSASTVTVRLQDGSGDLIKTVQVITASGIAVGGQSLDASGGELTISVPEGYPYYYLKVLQEDGDVAVTAPVWVDTAVDARITSFTADTTTPVQGQPVQLTLGIENNESEPFVVQALEISLNGSVLYTEREPFTVPARDVTLHHFSITYSGLGSVELTAAVTGTIGASPYTCEETTLSLRYQANQPEISLSTIAYARQGTEGQVYRVKGYVTAGTLNSYNTFPGMLYLQDETGGIGITSFADTGIQPGAPLEVTGYLTGQEGSPVLELLDYELLSGSYYHYTPETLSISNAMNWDQYGGQLLQIQGMVLSLTRTADGLGISRFTLRDASGAQAMVRIDDGILSGTYGTNQLTAQVVAGRYVRAKGILHRETDGTLVLRVRNCDEVVAVSASSAQGAVADPTNPKTGRVERFTAPFGAGVPTSLLLAVLAITAAGLAALYRMKTKRR